jgi:hypothetical protein
MPAKASIQRLFWIPAFAGMTMKVRGRLSKILANHASEVKAVLIFAALLFAV